MSTNIERRAGGAEQEVVNASVIFPDPFQEDIEALGLPGLRTCKLRVRTTRCSTIGPELNSEEYGEWWEKRMLVLPEPKTGKMRVYAFGSEYPPKMVVDTGGVVSDEGKKEGAIRVLRDLVVPEQAFVLEMAGIRRLLEENDRGVVELSGVEEKRLKRTLRTKQTLLDLNRVQRRIGLAFLPKPEDFKSDLHHEPDDIEKESPVLEFVSGKYQAFLDKSKGARPVEASVGSVPIATEFDGGSRNRDNQQAVNRKTGQNKWGDFALAGLTIASGTSIDVGRAFDVLAGKLLTDEQRDALKTNAIELFGPEIGVWMDGCEAGRGVESLPAESGSVPAPIAPTGEEVESLEEETEEPVEKTVAPLEETEEPVIQKVPEAPTATVEPVENFDWDGFVGQTGVDCLLTDVEIMSIEVDGGREAQLVVTETGEVYMNYGDGWMKGEREDGEDGVVGWYFTGVGGARDLGLYLTPVPGEEDDGSGVFFIPLSELGGEGVEGLPVELPDGAIKVLRMLMPVESGSLGEGYQYEEMEVEVEAEVRAGMPELWYYNDQNELVRREQGDFEIRYSDERHLHLIALDGEGNKIAWADFSKADYGESVWYSVTDTSKNTLMPIAFATKMGEYEESWTVAGGGGVKHYVDQAVIRFRDEGELWVGPGTQDLNQMEDNNFIALIDESERNLESGEAIMEAYVIRLATELYNLNNEENMTVGEMRDLLSRGETALIDVDGVEWDVSKGLEITWTEVAEARYVDCRADDGVLKIKMSTMGGVKDSSFAGYLGFDVPENMVINKQERSKIQKIMLGLLDFYNISEWKIRRAVQVDVLNR
ncbi:hypothetical protein KJ953_00905 [Patescibacteria group bacterium]|nr:hypothetical protein [Patescibacteria group bacterium]